MAQTVAQAQSARKLRSKQSACLCVRGYVRTHLLFVMHVYKNCRKIAISARRRVQCIC